MKCSQHGGILRNNKDKFGFLLFSVEKAIGLEYNQVNKMGII